MARHFAALLVFLAGCSDGGGSSDASGGGTPSAASDAPAAWSTADVGSVGQPGTFSIEGPVFRLAGSGADIWGASDAFRFAWLPLRGDGRISARVTGLDPTDEWAKAGVMIRASLDPAAPFAMAVVTPSHGTSFQWRGTAGGACDLSFGPDVRWVRVTRAGDLFTGETSGDGKTWTLVGTRSIPMGVDVLMGLCLTAHNNTLKANATIESVAVSTPAFEVTLNDPFWAPRLATNRTASTPQLVQQIINDHTVENFAKAAGLMGGNHAGFPWADGDVYRIVGAVAEAYRGQPNPYEGWMDTVIGHIAAAQRADGYLNTYFQLGNAGRGPGGSTLALQPWEDLIGAHEDAVIGSLIEGAIQHYRATGRTTFLDVARRAADHVASIFGEGRRVGVPGHQEIEAALLKLWRLEGRGAASDFELAKFYLDERGRHSGGRPIYGEYCQDLRPIREETEPLGHCVRMMYQNAAAADLAAATGDAGLLTALESAWTNLVERKMHPTGGFGHYLYNEGFGPDWDLEAEQAYNETCAACGMLFWTWRMSTHTRDARYDDVLERVLYNTYAAASSLDGTRLYYNGHMTRSGDRNRFGIPCCSTNIVRTLPTIPGYQYSTRGGLWTHLYMAGDAQLPVGGVRIGLRQITNYPWEGAVRIEVTAPAPAAFTLQLRIPEWAAGAAVAVNGRAQPVVAPRGWLPLARTWASGDVVELNLPMSPRRLRSDPRVWAHRGRAAIARGPLVYCLESPDHGIDVHKIIVPAGAALTAEHDAGLLGGVTTLRGTGVNADTGAPTEFRMIPYAVWDNRAHDSRMVVVVPESAPDLSPDRGRLGAASLTASQGGTPAAVHDGRLPRNSEDGSIPRFTWGGPQGTEEWITAEFASPLRIQRSDLFWFNDQPGGGGCDFPQSFRHEYWTGSGWAPLQLDADYMNAVDLYAPWHFTIVRFAPVTTTKVRLLVQLKPGKSAGLLEWRLPE